MRTPGRVPPSLHGGDLPDEAGGAGDEWGEERSGLGPEGGACWGRSSGSCGAGGGTDDGETYQVDRASSEEAGPSPDVVGGPGGARGRMRPPVLRQRRRKSAPEKIPPMMSPIKSLFGRRTTAGLMLGLPGSTPSLLLGLPGLALPGMEGEEAGQPAGIPELRLRRYAAGIGS